jgi:AAA+ superfamily predicted ATPase/tellurite resistance protein
MCASASNADVSENELLIQFRRELSHCQRLFDDAARLCIESHPNLLRQDPPSFRRQMLELHRGMLVKIVVEIAQSDWQWTDDEYLVAVELFEHCWGRRLNRAELTDALKEVTSRCGELSWDHLYRPFARFPVLRTRIGDLQTVVLRVANLVAKIDGQVSPEETQRLKWIGAELERCLVPLPLDLDEPPDVADGGAALRLAKETDEDCLRPPRGRTIEEPLDSADRQHLLDAALNDLRGLIGIDCIKREISELTNFLKVQRERDRRGMPQTKVSLHMIFAGNPGTGKTTVARLLGRILGGLNILSRGHLIETDRAGLVAGYAGQTSSKTHKKIDEALDGVLFIDEAYSLVAEEGDDPYGSEAVQALLKRIEDDRDRLVVILAGYPAPMDRLLDTNPGLASRFGRRLEFPDYTPAELGRIFQSMCEANHYSLPAAARLRLLVGFQYLLDRRDEKFGNGRLVRNVFETAIRRLANRIADVAPLTAKLLTHIEPADIVLPEAPESVYHGLDGGTVRISAVCPGCGETLRCQASFLARRVRCKRCSHDFQLDWGDLDRS